MNYSTKLHNTSSYWWSQCQKWCLATYTCLHTPAPTPLPPPTHSPTHTYTHMYSCICLCFDQYYLTPAQSKTLDSWIHELTWGNTSIHSWPFSSCTHVKGHNTVALLVCKHHRVQPFKHLWYTQCHSCQISSFLGQLQSCVHIIHPNSIFQLPWLCGYIGMCVQSYNIAHHAYHTIGSYIGDHAYTCSSPALYTMVFIHEHPDQLCACVFRPLSSQSINQSVMLSGHVS